MDARTEFEFQPVLIGPTITLRPLRSDDFDGLHAAASDPLIWEQHPDPGRYEREAFRERFFAGGLESGGAFLVFENSTSRIIGSSRFYDWDEAKREIAIGYTFLIRDHWGGRANAEMKKLMLDHAFRWAGVVWLHIGVDNWRSRKAAEKIGAIFSHTEEKQLKGVTQARAFYRIDRDRFVYG
jgi:RimJ/RimL family protein N-acetyltransferase